MVLAVIDDDEISLRNVVLLVSDPVNPLPLGHKVNLKAIVRVQEEICLLYTSDAADEL